MIGFRSRTEVQQRHNQILFMNLFLYGYIFARSFLIDL
jgi:hypothetical protein